jgi:hypothetical protein
MGAASRAIGIVGSRCLVGLVAAMQIDRQRQREECADGEDRNRDQVIDTVFAMQAERQQPACYGGEEDRRNECSEHRPFPTHALEGVGQRIAKTSSLSWEVRLLR